MGVFGIPAPGVAGLSIVAVTLFVISLAFCEMMNEKWRLYVSTFTLQIIICMVLLTTWWTIPLSADATAGAVIAGMFIIPTEIVFGAFITGCAKVARRIGS